MFKGRRRCHETAARPRRERPRLRGGLIYRRDGDVRLQRAPVRLAEEAALPPEGWGAYRQLRAK